MLSEKDGAALLDGPIPGEGLTSDPQNPMPWESPPDYVHLEDFIDDLFMNVTEPDNLSDILDPIRKGIPIEDVAGMLLFQAMSTGKITTDLLLMAIEPTIYMLMGLAEYAGIPNPVLYPEDEMDQDEDEEISALEKAARGEDVSFEEMQAPKGVSRSLIAKLKSGDIEGDSNSGD